MKKRINSYIAGLLTLSHTGFSIANPMQQADPLANLGPLIAAAPIATSGPFVWPPALGWWVSLVLIIASIISISWLIKKSYAKKQVRARYYGAFSKVNLLKSNQTEEEQSTYVRQLTQAIKAIALERFGNKEVATLSGQAWLEFLDTTGKCNHFTNGSGQVFGKSMYQPTIKNIPDCDHLMTICQDWVKEIS